jgi:hypothetical protein
MNCSSKKNYLRILTICCLLRLYMINKHVNIDVSFERDQILDLGEGVFVVVDESEGQRVIIRQINMIET